MTETAHETELRGALKQQCAREAPGAGSVSIGVLRLARVVALAARLEPELLRCARVMLLRGVEAGAEADLRFGALVQSDSASSIVFWTSAWLDHRAGSVGCGWEFDFSLRTS